MDKGQLRELIQLVLKEYDLYSRDAEEILMLTCAAESNMGKYIKQVGGGPALGIFQCEPATLEWANDKLEQKQDKAYYKYKDALLEEDKLFYLKWNKIYIQTNILADTDHQKLRFMCNILDQIIAARLVYYFKTPKALPSYKDVQGMAEYYKKYYNSILGAATVEGTIAKYNKYVKG